MSDRIDYICTKTIEWSLIFIIAAVPLIINPVAFDVWYRPKIISVYVLVIIAGTAWILRVVFQDGSFARYNTPLTILLLLYLGAALLSTIFSIDVQLSLFGDFLRVEGFFSIVAYAALVFLFANQVVSQDLQEKLITGLIIATTLVSIYALVQYSGYDPTEHFFYKYWRRGPGVGSTMGNQNFLGKYLVLIIPIIFARCFYPVSRTGRLVASVYLVLCFAALMATFTRASWLSMVVSVITFLYLAFRFFLLAGKMKQLIVYLILLIAVGVIFNSYTFGNTAKNQSSFKRKEAGAVVKRTISSLQLTEGRGVATRLYVWEKALYLIKKRPWLGYGLETFQIAFRPYNKDYIQRFNDFTMVDRVHNNYLDTAFSMGLSGLAAYVVILASFLIYLWHLIKAIQGRTDRLFFIGIFSGFIGYLVNDLFIFSVVSVSPTFWSLMGLTLAAGNIARKEGNGIIRSVQQSAVHAG